jgi:hypothetical protein
MSKINFTVGFWRLWVFLTILWVIPVTFIKFDDLTASYKGQYNPKLADQGINLLASSEEQIEINKLINNARLCRDAKDFFAITHYCDEWVPIDEGVTVSVPIWSTRLPAFGWIILPPLGLLCLGLGIGWVVNGFGRQV